MIHCVQTNTSYSNQFPTGFFSAIRINLRLLKFTPKNQLRNQDRDQERIFLFLLIEDLACFSMEPRQRGTLNIPHRLLTESVPNSISLRSVQSRLLSSFQFGFQSLFCLLECSRNLQALIATVKTDYFHFQWVEASPHVRSLIQSSDTTIIKRQKRMNFDRQIFGGSEWRLCALSILFLQLQHLGLTGHKKRNDANSLHLYTLNWK